MQTGAVRLSEREIGLATGPITLSRASGAPLLPLFVVRKGPAKFEAIVEAAIDVPEGRDYEAPLNQYARVLEKYVRLQPAAWRSPK
jgi:lauroyl/myristoyl acyltransferase